ncbi:MAG: DUF2953 domain-containing protein [Peptococcaceae bacterium]|nr:DUF2953 domain-containing protein [Peptococcaceae bacterium]
MEIALYLLAGLLLLTALFLAAPLEIRLRYCREEERVLLGLDLSFWLFPGLRCRVFRYRPDADKGGRAAGEKKKMIMPGPVEMIRQISFWREIYSQVRPSINYFKDRLKITELTWKTRFGLGDPFCTGTAAGVIWSLKGAVVSYLSSRVRFAKAPVLAVAPDFEKAFLATGIDFRLAARTGHIVFTALRVLAALAAGGRAGDLVRMIKRMIKNTPDAGKDRG